ncbi:hypothetical protein GCM10027280_50530 [Micromonospora polyrhachis]
MLQQQLGHPVPGTQIREVAGAQVDAGSGHGGIGGRTGHRLTLRELRRVFHYANVTYFGECLQIPPAVIHTTG